MAADHFQPLDAADPLGEVLHMLRLNGTLYCRAELAAPWGIAMPHMVGSMVFVVVTAGEGWVRMAGSDPVRLGRGGMVLIPHGSPVDLSSGPGQELVPLFDLPVTQVSERYELLQIEGPGELTRAMTGVVSFDDVAARRLIESLPPILLVDRWDDAAGIWLSSTLDLIAHEAATLKPGGEVVITRLADILIIQALRIWLETAPEARRGWLAALRDRQLGRALSAMHRQPEAAWTLDGLARLAGMSRSSFAARFTETVGQPAMRYLGEWRLNKARIALLEGRDPIAEVARKTGYQSEPAFGRAFKQHFGMPPGALRRVG